MDHDTALEEEASEGGGDGGIERERLLRLWRLNPEAEVDLCADEDAGGGGVWLSDKAGNQIDEFRFGSAEEADRAVDYALKEIQPHR